MSLYSRFVTRYSGTRWFAWAASRVGPGLDRVVHKLSGGRRMATPSSIPTLLLTTTGRRSGQERSSPLSFVTIDGHPHVVGTNFGRTEHPGWTSNLLAHPIATIEFQMERWTARAVPVAASVQENLWPLFYDLLPAYRLYRSRVNRSVRMFRLERV